VTSPARRPRYPGADLPGRRIFVAVPLPDPAKQAVEQLVDRVRAAGVPGGGRDVRWVRLDGLHLTLRFLGPTLEARIQGARDAVLEVAAGAHPFELSIGRAGTFPAGPRPRALWLGVADPDHALEDLAGRMDARLVRAGWPAETRPFRAHLTLARADGVAAGARIGAHLSEAAEDVRIAFPIDRIGLFESVTGGGPARYEPIELVALGGP
jgi:RNA 2',3'-cyclic 3'-phosphodiesterase